MIWVALLVILLETSLLGASDVACGEGDRPVSSGARVIDDASGGYADVDGELPGSNAEGADSVSRALPVVSCARDLARWTLPLLDLVCCVCWLEDTLLITVVALVQASLPAARVLSA